MLREAPGLIGDRPAILLAPSAAAARVLGQETGGRARTLQWFLTRYGDIGNAEKTDAARRQALGDRDRRARPHLCPLPGLGPDLLEGAAGM